MIHGFLNINKPAGMTSHSVVARLRRILAIKKIGHTGTLDPDVTGVLPIAIGQATKLSQYLLEADKVYEGQLILGISTDTEDYSGEITEIIKGLDQLDCALKLTREEIQESMQGLVGQIEQIPPMYSAVKVKGKRLYQLARQGQEVDRKSRLITIHEFTCQEVGQFIHEGEPYPLINFRLACSKGTYARTICVQLGEILGYPATMYSLVRTETASFDLNTSISLELVEESQAEGKMSEILLNMDVAVGHLPAIYLDQADSNMVLNGMKIKHSKSIYHENITDNIQNNNSEFYIEDIQEGQEFRIYNPDRQLIAIYQLAEEDDQEFRLKATKVFREAVIND